MGNYKSGEDMLQLSCVACLEQIQALSGQEGNSMPQEPQAQTNEIRITNTSSNRGEDTPGAHGRFKTWDVKARATKIRKHNNKCFNFALRRPPPVATTPFRMLDVSAPASHGNF